MIHVKHMTSDESSQMSNCEWVYFLSDDDLAGYVRVILSETMEA